MGEDTGSNDGRYASRQQMVKKILSTAFEPPANFISMELAAGGNSRETWVVEIEDRNGRRKIVFRCDPDHWIRPAEMRRETAGLRLANQTGVPSPGVLVTEDQVDIGRPFVLTEYVEGCTIARRILRDDAFTQARHRFVEDCARILARLHGATDLAAEWPKEDPMIDLETHRSKAGYPSPVLLGALNWLYKHQPAMPDKPSPVHRDFRIGNLSIDESGIVAVLDWETCALSDPLEDIAWLCSRAWRYGSDMPVGGIGTLEDLLARYESYTGTTIDRNRLHWWQVYAETRWGLASAAVPQASRGGDGMEAAAIARQVSRQEYNVLLTLKGVQ